LRRSGSGATDQFAPNPVDGLFVALHADLAGDTPAGAQ